MELLVVVFMLFWAAVFSQGTLTGNCLKVMWTNAGLWSKSLLLLFLTCLTIWLKFRNILNHHSGLISAWEFPPNSFRRSWTTEIKHFIKNNLDVFILYKARHDNIIFYLYLKLTTMFTLRVVLVRELWKVRIIHVQTICDNQSSCY